MGCYLYSGIDYQHKGISINSFGLLAMKHDSHDNLKVLNDFRLYHDQALKLSATYGLIKIKTIHGIGSARD